MPAIPDTLYMLDEPSRLAAVQCASVPSQQQQTSPGGSAVDIIAGTIPGKEFHFVMAFFLFKLFLLSYGECNVVCSQIKTLINIITG